MNFRSVREFFNTNLDGLVYIYIYVCANKVGNFFKNVNDEQAFRKKSFIIPNFGGMVLKKTPASQDRLGT